MPGSALTQLLHGVGPSQIVGFFLVLARVSPLFVLAPLFSSPMVPPRARGIVAVALAVGLTPLALRGQHVPTQPLQIAELAAAGLLVGLSFAFAVAAVLAAVQTAAALIDDIAGFSFAQLVNPAFGNSGGVMSTLYSLVALAIFIAIGGDAWMLRGIGRTFALVPISRGPKLASIAGAAEHAFATIFASAIEVAAPALLALLITDIAFGMVSRVVPQINVFAVEFPLKVGVAILIVGASLTFLTGWMSDQLGASVGSALQALSLH
jgi:flagellar biosynthesis protein FliR